MTTVTQQERERDMRPIAITLSIVVAAFVLAALVTLAGCGAYQPPGAGLSDALIISTHSGAQHARNDN